MMCGCFESVVFFAQPVNTLFFGLGFNIM